MSDTENKPTLLLLHGALGSTEQFDELNDIFQNNFNVHVLNFEGHGGRPLSSEDFGIDTFVKNVHNYMDEHDISDAHLFGFSMGGYVALKFAIQYPDLVNKIVTLGTKFDWSPESAKKETRMMDPDNIEDTIPHYARMLKKRHEPLDWKEVMNKTAEMMHELGNGASIEKEDLSRIDHETLILRGGDDHMVTEAESMIASRLIRNSDYQVIPSFHHAIEKNNPYQLSHIVTKFLKD